MKEEGALRAQEKAEKTTTDEEHISSIGPLTKALRLSLGLTLQDVSDKAGLSKPLISQIENGLVIPPLQTLSKISNALNQDISFYFAPPGRSAPKNRQKRIKEAISQIRTGLSVLETSIPGIKRDA